MSDRVEIYRHTCHCGHDRDTHFERRHACLGMRCDCDAYVNEHAPKRTQQIPAAQPIPDPWGDPYVDDFVDDTEPATDPYPTWPMFPAGKP